MNKTHRAISLQYTWPKMRRQVRNYFKPCEICQVYKILIRKKKAAMQVPSTADRPFVKCYLDVVGPNPVTVQGNKYILTFQKDLSKYILAVCIEKQDSKSVTKDIFREYFYCTIIHRLYKRSTALNIMSDVIRDNCSLLNVKKFQSTVFHPESQGSIERRHRVLVEYLRHYVSEDQTDWAHDFRSQLT